MSRLLLAEELFLLTHDAESGTVKMGVSPPGGFARGFAGALLLDLAAQGLVTSDGDALSPAASTPDDLAPLLGAALAEIRESDAPQTASHWITKLPRALKPLEASVGASLVERGILSQEHGKRFGLVPVATWPEADPDPEADVRERLRQVLVDGTEPDLRTELLIALVSPLGLVREVVDKADRKAAEERAKAIAERDATHTSDAIRKAITAIRAAVIMAAVVVATSG